MHITCPTPACQPVTTFPPFVLKPKSEPKKMIRSAWFAGLCLMTFLAIPGRTSPTGELKVSYAFQKSGSVDCQMALTKDSVGVMEIDSTAGSREPDDENGFEQALRKRALSASERDTADMLIHMSGMWKGLKRYTCEKNDGYAFSLWSDSLSLHCNNCFSCTEGITVQEARTLARFGKLTLWLYQLRQDPSLRLQARKD
jgi:hypothetical protein